jgi:hypothetical protein
MFILITGNPVDGFTYEGPFATADLALDYVEYTDPPDYWIAQLEQPEARRGTRGWVTARSSAGSADRGSGGSDGQ